MWRIVVRSGAVRWQTAVGTLDSGGRCQEDRCARRRGRRHVRVRRSLRRSHAMLESMPRAGRRVTGPRRRLLRSGPTRVATSAHGSGDDAFAGSTAHRVLGFNHSRLRGHRYERNRPIGGIEATPGAKQPNPKRQSMLPHLHRGRGRIRNAKPAHARKVDPDETTRAQITEPPRRGWCQRQPVTIASVMCGTPPWLDRWLVSADGRRGAPDRR